MAWYVMLYGGLSPIDLLILPYYFPGFCPVKYVGKCFWVEVREGEKIGCDEIESICSDGGGKPASVYSQLHYEELVRFIRSVVMIKPSSPHENYLDSWIAASYHSPVCSQH